MSDTDVSTVPTSVQHVAREGIQRVLYISIGLTAAIFGAIHAGQIMEQLDALSVVYGYLAVAVSVVMPSALALVAWLAPARFAHAYTKLTVILFAAVHAAWPLFMTVEFTEQTPWFQSVNAIPALLAAVTWRHRWVWWYAMAQLPLVAVTNYVSTGGELKDAILAGVVSIMFSGILVGVGLALVAAGDQQDQVAATARQQAAVEASTRTREREQKRINGIVRDEVMSALVLAGREPYSSQVAQRARAALDRIVTLTTERTEAADYSPAGVVDALRSATEDAGPDVEFWHTNNSESPVPAAVVEAISEALSEAVRNSVRHADSPDGPVYRLVRIAMADDSVWVRVEDTGRGFTLAGIGSRRLGVRVSILERMRSLPGGDAQIESRPGHGTKVTLTWRRPV